MLTAFVAGVITGTCFGFYSGIVAAIYLDRYVTSLYTLNPRERPTKTQPLVAPASINGNTFS